MSYEKYKKLVGLIIDYGHLKWECGDAYQKFLNDEVSHEVVTNAEADAAEMLDTIIAIMLDK